MKKAMKKMVLTGAAVTVMMSFAAPAMADEVQEEQHAGSSNSSVSGIVDEQPFKDPGIRLCDITPTECEISTDPVDDPAHHPVNKDPDIISADPVDDPSHPPVNKDPGTNDDPSTVENPKTGNTPVDEEASAPGAVKAEVIPEGIIPAAPKNDDYATSAPEPASGSESPLVTGCAFDGEEYFEPFSTCVPSVESFDFVSVLTGAEPWPDSAGGYVGLAGGLVEDWLSLAGLNTAVSASLTEDALVELGKDGGPIGWGIQGVGYTAGFVGEVGGMLLVGAGEVAGIVHEGLGDVVDTVADAAGDAWDEISSWF